MIWCWFLSHGLGTLLTTVTLSPLPFPFFFLFILVSKINLPSLPSTLKRTEARMLDEILMKSGEPSVTPSGSELQKAGAQRLAYAHVCSRIHCQTCDTIRKRTGAQRERPPGSNPSANNSSGADGRSKSEMTAANTPRPLIRQHLLGLLGLLLEHRCKSQTHG
jgi:hypothetical protein